jgi:DNA-binding NtrC family response regulator
MSHRVLILDDEAVARRMMRTAAAKHYDVAVAGSVLDAFNLLDPHDPPAVIVADHVMPDMTGTEFLACCEKICPLSARVLLTPCADRAGSSASGGRSRAFHVLPKPVTSGELLATLDEAVLEHERALSAQGCAGTTFPALRAAW